MEKKHWLIVKKILAKYPYAFYVFGLRVKVNARCFSDLDICFFENIPLSIQAHIDEDFEESDLPYKVDIIDWNFCNKTFQQIIEKDLILIQASAKNEQH